MKFIHFTDTHLVGPDPRQHGIDTFARLDGCLASIAAEHGDAALCVLTGDLADRAEPAAYEGLRDRLASFALPVHLLLGNHDLRETFLATFPDTPLDDHGFVQDVVETPAGAFLLLDTVETGESGGSYCTRRMAWLEARLEEYRGHDVYVFMHHPPFDVGIPGLDRIGIAEPEPLARALTEAGNVRHVFCGHLHRPVSGSFRGVAFSTLFATAHQVGLQMTPGEKLRYTGEPPAYSIVLLEPDRVLVHTHCYEEDQANVRGRP